jgi:hypothetical protein
MELKYKRRLQRKIAMINESSEGRSYLSQCVKVKGLSCAQLSYSLHEAVAQPGERHRRCKRDFARAFTLSGPDIHY